ncbi:MAG: transporter [Myxococcales bacterium]|nr:transporter [Myxococcales bacterium]|tara:strand:+ start:82 stop:342 length:261 start_codon:yes stop_codon:yes gene_type:complete
MSTASLLTEGMAMLALNGAPLFMTLLVVGILMGMLQAATQINDPAIGFVPRIVGGGAICWFFGRWMLENFAGFFTQAALALPSIAP